jgi:formylglycine-generating enzyme required for sulfatase activity
MNQINKNSSTELILLKAILLIVITGTLFTTVLVSIILTRKSNQEQQAEISGDTNIVETSSNLNCPTGYIKVPGNSLYETKDFCVMKYEAKAVSASGPTVGLTEPNTGFNTIDNNITTTTSANGRAIASVANGFPISNIDQSTAADYCTDTGASLINNREWMTIARNIEAQPSNWSNNIISNANSLNKGHSRSQPEGALPASTNDLEGCIGYTNGRTCTNQWHVNRRTHNLSNGEVIWDLSGNVEEWTSDTILGKDQPTGSSTESETGWLEYTDITNFGTLSRDLVGPSNSTWNSRQNMGRIYGEGSSNPNTVFGFLRGGGWGGTNNSTGVFFLSLADTPVITSNDEGQGIIIGFRCVVR